MIDLFLNLPEAVQIFLFMCALVGLYVIWKFKTLFVIVSGFVIAIYMKVKKK